MVRCALAVLSVAAILLTVVVVVGPEATGLSCAPDEEALTFEEMIDQDITGKERYPTMILGVVVAIRDLGGRPDGGRSLARLEVVEHPVRWTPDVSRVRFQKEFPGSSSFDYQFRPGGRHVVIGRRLADGSFSSDGDCGQTQRLKRSVFRELARYARSH